MSRSAGQSAPTPRSRNAEATRADLLHAAMRRFTVLGYERTTTRDIALDAQVNVSLISRYFGSKDGLFEAVMHESASTLEQSTPDGPAGLVEAMMRHMGPDAWPEFGGEHPLLLLLRDVGVDERIRELRRRALGAVVARLADQLNNDQPLTTEDAELRAELLLALLAGVLTIRTALPDHRLATADMERLRSTLTLAVSAILGARSA